MVLHAVYVQKMLHVMDVAQRNVRIMIFVKTYGEEKLLDCLERNEKNGIVYLTLIGKKELPLNLFEVVDIEDKFPVERVKSFLNEKE